MTDGTVEQRDGRVTFRYERLLNHSVEAVWQAITDPEQLARWLGTRPEIDLRPGGEYVTVHTSPDGATTHRVVDTVVRLEPPHLFEHTFWVQVNPSALVTWELTPVSERARLDLTHAVDLADLKAAAGTVANGDDLVTMLARNGAGWHRLLDKLTSVLDGTEPAWSPAAQQALQQHYAALVR
ncbi:MAG TPA: SRPBCC family protein [Pseudonocardiaceae bacterium]|nr:SRPBCC family protein [Pseudonocardiaceae bacterium]